MKSSHGFASLARLEDVTNCLSSVLFVIIVLSFMAGSSKNIQIKEEDKVSKKVGGKIFFKNLRENQNGIEFFHFHFVAISYYDS